MENINPGKTDQAVIADACQDYRTAIERAVRVLLSGGIVAYPTETFYGLAVDATNEHAIRRLFLLKKRDIDSPVLILIPSKDMIGQYAAHISSLALRLMEDFWPGGLTIIFEAGPTISSLLTAGTGKIGIRLSSHPVATGLAMAIGVPITGTSANISGETACVDAKEVSNAFSTGINLILDGGKTQGGKGSTILDITEDPPKILREGIVTREDLKGYLSV